MAWERVLTNVEGNQQGEPYTGPAWPQSYSAITSGHVDDASCLGCMAVTLVAEGHAEEPIWQ